MSGRPTSNTTRSSGRLARASMPFDGGAGVGDLELVVQSELIPQRAAQILVVVDEKNLACRAHAAMLRIVQSR